MAEKVTPGVVIVNRFTSPGSKQFRNYINYINRENAVRNENFSKFVIPEIADDLKNFGEYNEYMGNPNKTTELFTDDKDNLTDDEKQQLKNTFEIAEQNQSLMWQTVISFDNKWLQENNVLNPETNELDEDKTKNCARLCMEKILEKEKIKDSAIWSGAIHYNTDNIHIHIAVVEPIPSRETKMLRTIKFNSEWVKEHISSELLDKVQTNKKINAYREKRYNINYSKIIDELKTEVEKGSKKPLKVGNYIKINEDFSIEISFNGEKSEIPMMAELKNEVETQVGVFKQSSIRAGKSFIVNEISNTAELQKNINDIIRKNIYGNIKNQSIAKDRALRKQFLSIYRQLPADRRLWKYGMNAMKDLRPQIDQLVNMFVLQNNAEDWQALNVALDKQTEVFLRGYGLSNADDYKDNKIREFYQRCGNAVLKELQSFDRDIREAEKKKNNKYHSKKFSLDKEIKIMRHTVKKLNRLVLNEYEHARNLAIYEQEFEPQ
ncbi:MAG: MobP2 family relaxase [Acutalibacteraceae bacterium]